MTLFILSAACGVGKTTVKDELLRRDPAFACIDADQVGLSWWDYAGTEREEEYKTDTLRAATELAGGRDLLFASCLNPLDYFRSVTPPPEIERTFFIGMVCSDCEIRRRLKARPPEYRCGGDDFIKAQIDYNNWFRRNSGKFQLFIDNSGQNPGETADIAERFIKKITELPRK